MPVAPDTYWPLYMDVHLQVTASAEGRVAGAVLLNCAGEPFQDQVGVARWLAL